MVSHVQLNANGEFSRFIKTGVLYEWDENNYCTVTALEADSKAEEFKVFPLHVAPQPVHNADTQFVQESTPLLIGNEWTQQWEVVDMLADEVAATRFNSDQFRYRQRAAVKDDLISYMAADNMSRVRNGTWTVPELMNLLDDPAVAAANAYMATLSYELAAQAIASAATPLLTSEIRADWIARLQAHFYLE